jgi:hypothetical protein
MPEWPKREGYWPQVGPYEPLDLFREDSWVVLDPNDARLLAVFHDEKLAHEFVAWLNGKWGFTDVKVTPPRGD